MVKTQDMTQEDLRKKINELLKKVSSLEEELKKAYAEIDSLSKEVLEAKELS
jgi:hypothetical protein